MNYETAVTRDLDSDVPKFEGTSIEIGRLLTSLEHGNTVEDFCSAEGVRISAAHSVLTEAFSQLRAKPSPRGTKQESLFKYAPLSRINDLLHPRSVVRNGSPTQVFDLRFTIPADLNDPHDCKPALIDADQVLEKVTGFKLENLQGDSIVNWTYVGTELKGFDPTGADYDRIINAITTRQLDDPRLVWTLFKELIEARLDQLKASLDSIGVLCFASTFDALTMWSHYAENHNGICIEFDGLALKEFIEGEYNATWYSVEYGVDRPVIDSMKFEGAEIIKFFELAFGRKHASWGVELEWRAIAFLHEATSVQIVRGRPVHLFQVESRFVKSVTLGLRIEPDVARAVADGLKRSGQNSVAVYLARMNDDHYQIDRTPVHPFSGGDQS